MSSILSVFNKYVIEIRNGIIQGYLLQELLIRMSLKMCVENLLVYRQHPLISECSICWTDFVRI